MKHNNKKKKKKKKKEALRKARSLKPQNRNTAPGQKKRSRQGGSEEETILVQGKEKAQGRQAMPALPQGLQRRGRAQQPIRSQRTDSCSKSGKREWRDPAASFKWRCFSTVSLRRKRAWATPGQKKRSDKLRVQRLKLNCFRNCFTTFPQGSLHGSLMRCNTTLKLILLEGD